ncbi:MAG: ATP-binding cassette domain-containing protein, partial [Ignavibacteria bacterium]|nr:ATP-binding cassette domain-containing protein [Ignavibacteria bacterium]
MPQLELRHIGKSFPGVRALNDVSFSVEKGEIHALCGENGAGKSTLIKILSGVYPRGSYDGEFLVNGASAQFRNIRDAENSGIAVIYQELALVRQMTVGENIYLGNEPQRFGVIDWVALHANASEVLHQLGLDIDSRTPVQNLGIGAQQLVEIAKALSKRSDILILDEPSAALSDEEIQTLMAILRGLRERGVTCLYITHKLREVHVLADRVTVLRDGNYIGTRDISAINEHLLISMMVGRDLTEFYPRQHHTRGTPVLSVRNLTVHDPDIPSRKIIDDVSFDIYNGEILGLSGLMGSGRTELLMSIFGAPPGPRTGNVAVNGSPADIRHPHDAIRYGLGLVSEDRKRFGLVLQATVEHNLSLASLRLFSRTGVIESLHEGQRCRQMVDELSIKVASIDVSVNTLSGGNQQKVVLGKWLMTNPKVLFLDEPTRG